MGEGEKKKEEDGHYHLPTQLPTNPPTYLLTYPPIYRTYLPYLQWDEEFMKLNDGAPASLPIGLRRIKYMMTMAMQTAKSIPNLKT